MLDLNDLHVYIDGSGRHNPRRGGIGIKFVFLEGEQEKEETFPHQGFPAATNNQMELTACIKAMGEILKFPHVQRFKKIIIYSDSQYVTENGGNALYNWPKNKWRKTSGGLVENADLWKEYRKLRIKITAELRGIRLEIIYKPRRSNNHMRDVDNLAKKSSLDIVGKPFRVVDVRRHRLPVKSGEITFTGQKMSIHVVTAAWEKVQRMNKYSLHIITKDHPDYCRKGIIFSPDIMRAGHRYQASFQEVEGDPGIHRIIIHKEYQLKQDKISS